MFSAILKWLQDILITPIVFIFFSASWVLLVALPFNIAEIVHSVSGLFGFGLVKTLFFGKTDLNTGEAIQVPWIFIAILAISVVLSIVMFIYGILKGNFSSTEEGERDLKNVLKQSLKSVFGFLLIPIIYAASLVFLETVYEVVSKVFINNGDLNELQNIFLELKPKNITENEWANLVSNHLWNTDSIYSSYKRFAYGEGSLLVILFSLIALTLLAGTSLITLSVGLKTVLIYFNMILAPVALSFSIKDSGRTFKTFLKETIGHIGSVFALQFLFKFLMLYIIATAQIELTEKIDLGGTSLAGLIVNFITKLCLILAGTWAVYLIVKKINSMSGGLMQGVSSTANLTKGLIKNDIHLVNKSLASMNSYSTSEQHTSSLKEQNEILKEPQYSNYSKLFLGEDKKFKTLPQRKK